MWMRSCLIQRFITVERWINCSKNSCHFCQKRKLDSNGSKLVMRHHSISLWGRYGGSSLTSEWIMIKTQKYQSRSHVIGEEVLWRTFWRCHLLKMRQHPLCLWPVIVIEVVLKNEQNSSKNWWNMSMLIHMVGQEEEEIRSIWIDKLYISKAVVYIIETFHQSMFMEFIVIMENRWLKRLIYFANTSLL